MFSGRLVDSMSEMRNHQNLIRRELKRLPEWKQAAFMLSCCERMLPNFAAFAGETGVGNPAVLRQALDSAWNWIQDEVLPADLNKLRAACDEQAPDTAAFASAYTSAALDAANATASVLDFIERPDIEHAVTVATLATDSIDLYVQERYDIVPDDPDLDQKIVHAPLMDAELKRQESSLNRLLELKEQRQIAARILRQEWSQTQAGSLAD